MPSPKLSVVIPVFNEEKNIGLLLQQLKTCLMDIDYEIIIVDDGSTDHTLAELKGVVSPGTTIISFKKNFGQSLALMAGIDFAKGEFIATLDGDLQNDCADLPGMLKLAEQGDWDMVTGERDNRKDGFFTRKIPSVVANWIIRSATGTSYRDLGCSIRMFRSDLAKSLGLYGEMHRFIPVLAHLEGARITQVKVNHRARQFGKTKYGLGRTFKVLTDLTLMLFFKRFMQRPMHLFGVIGIGLFLVGAIINLYLLYIKLLGHDIWGKPLLLLGLMLVIGGIQFLTIGILVEMQMRTYFESQQKRPYKIRKIYR